MDQHSRPCITLLAEISSPSNSSDARRLRYAVAITPRGLVGLIYVVVTIVAAASGHGPTPFANAPREPTCSIPIIPII